MEIKIAGGRVRFPGIGMRIIKSAIGVFLCYVVDIFRDGHGIVFYSLLSVLWCMQEYKKDTLGKAKQRTIGTIVGAIYGLIVLLLAPIIYDDGSIFGKAFWGLMMALFTIVILYTTVVLKKKDASYFSCVVFLSIVVNHLTDTNPFLFVWNRVLDTLIGIGIGILVNACGLPRKHNNDILFVSGLDDTLLSREDNLSDYSRVELNRMIESGALFTVSTMRTPASLMVPLSDINMKLPVIVMDGAALYDIGQKRYLREYVISAECSEKIASLFDRMGRNYFTNVIVDDLLMIYCQDTDDTFYNDLIAGLRTSPYRNYVKRPLPKGQQVVYFMMVDEKSRMEEVYKALQNEPGLEKLKILFYDSVDYPGYAYIKIYNHNATREHMLQYLCEYVKAERVVTFGTIEGRYTHLIAPGDSNRVVKLMKKEYEPLKFLHRS